MEDNRGRPTKIEKFVEAFKKVIEDTDTTILTDKELFILVNGRLHKKNRISISTFEAWKGPSRDKYFDSHDYPKEAVEEFIDLMELTRVQQKLNLFNNLTDKKNRNWTQNAWLLERKFEDLNLKKVTENRNINENTQTVKIEVRSDDDAKLVEGITKIGNLLKQPEDNIQELKEGEDFTVDDVDE